MSRKTIAYRASVYKVLKDYGNEVYDVQKKNGTKKLKLKVINDIAYIAD